MDLQLQGGQSLDSAVEHIQMEEEMMTPKNILNTTFELVLVFPCKTDQPQRSWTSSTTAKRTVQLLCKALPLYPARLSEISVHRHEEFGLQITRWFIVISVFLRLRSCTTMLLKIVVEMWLLFLNFLHKTSNNTESYVSLNAQHKIAPSAEEQIWSISLVSLGVRFTEYTSPKTPHSCEDIKTQRYYNPAGDT